MLDHRNIADLVKVNGRFELSFFVPSQPAYMWDEMEGKRGILYAIQCQNYCKLGMTTNIEKRFKSIENGMPFDVTLVSKRTVQFAGLAYAEAWMHKQFWEFRAKNEWFKIEPAQASEKLREAGTVATAYARKCREWFYEDRAAKAADPAYQERMKRDYAKFAEKYRKHMSRPDMAGLPSLI